MPTQQTRRHGVIRPREGSVRHLHRNRPSNGKDAIRERPRMANSGSVAMKVPNAPLSGPFSKAKKSRYYKSIGLVFTTLKRDYFFLALGFGISVMLPSNISAARPIDSFNVG